MGDSRLRSYAQERAHAHRAANHLFHAQLLNLGLAMWLTLAHRTQANRTRTGA